MHPEAAPEKDVCLQMAGVCPGFSSAGSLGFTGAVLSLRLGCPLALDVLLFGSVAQHTGFQGLPLNCDARS